MREIKFRAWHKGYAPHKKHPPSMIHDEKPGDCLRWLADGQPLEVMEFTGLTDCNGVEIYEGDLIICEAYPFYAVAPGMEYYVGECREHNYTGEVYYWKEEAAYYVGMHVVSDRVRGSASGGLLREYATRCKVIGNIHENPELIGSIESE